MISDKDETIFELCKELKVINTIYPIANVENLDVNNLPILILHNNLNKTVSDLVIQNSQQILTDDHLTIITDNVIIASGEGEQSSLIITEKVIETSMVRESGELRKNLTRLLSSEEINTNKVPDITTQIVTDGLSDEKIILFKILIL
ncbi:hypothetical protein HHI36_006022 [Cryptolaemus montrouzieri]|uniref:Uncharacterized protein n=1 Tax=Cryptolaemus montrouzieri TaxID=559131 RepID=A0ABD2NVY2_9CUCU